MKNYGRFQMHYAWIITVIGAVLLLFGHGLARMSYSIILPFMKDDLSLTYTQVGLIATGNFIGYLLFTVFGGFLAARFGPRRIISISLFVEGISLFFTGFANSFSFAFVARLITGIGNGGCFVPMISLPAAWFVARKRGLGIGIVNIGVCAAIVMSGLVLPFCIACFNPEGWRYTWYLMGIAVFLCSFLAYGLLRNSPLEKGLRPYGEESSGALHSVPQPTKLSTAFRRVIAESEVWKLGCVYCMYGFSYMIYLTFFVAYLTKELGMEPALAGKIFAIIGFVAIFGGLLWGIVSDHIGRKYACVGMFLVLAISYALPGFFKGPTICYLSVILFGIAFSVPVLMAAAAGDAVGGQLAPAALGVITLLFAIAQTFGPYVGGYIKDATGTFTYAFMLCSAVALVGAGLSFLLKKKDARAQL
jgi:sugar phosphate permease